MNILFVTSEAVPFIKTGGLADVCGALPKELKKQGENITVILPKYKQLDLYFSEKLEKVCEFEISLGWRSQYCGVEKITLNNVDFLFIDNRYYFYRDYVYSTNPNEECERFSFFCTAVIEVCIKLGLSPDIIHCNDWQAAVIPFLLKTRYKTVPTLSKVKTVLTIHNLRYQGIFSGELARDLLSINDYYMQSEFLEYYGSVNFLKAGMVFADAVNTVSPKYAEEVKTEYYGEHLDGVIRAIDRKFSGILNGIDVSSYNPKTDKFIRTNYSATDISGKALCKEALQEELWLDKAKDTPLIVMVTRLADHKGLELVEYVAEQILSMNAEFAILGTGEKRYTDFFTDLAVRHGGRAGIKQEYNEALARRMYAGSDIFLMPSLFEPCGISQLIAMRYGSVPIVRETGGLCDTVIPYNRFTGEGNGISFTNYNAHEMLFAIEKAIDCYKNPEIWQGLITHAMKSDFSWKKSSKKYLELYKSIL